MKIGFISADWSDITDPDTGHPTPGGAGWYRMALPSKYLARNGIETVYCELVSIDRENSDHGIWLHDFDGHSHDNCDIIVVQRWMDERAAEVIEMGRKAGQIIVNDVDDWYWGLSPKNRAYQASDPKNNPRVNRDHYRRAVSASSALTVSTPFLQEKLDSSDTPAYLLRNAIDLERWEYTEPEEVMFPTIGWVGSTYHRSGDLETLNGVLSQVCKRINANFMHSGRFSGSDHAGTLAGLSEDILLEEDGCSILEYPKLFNGIDIGIVPLSDIPFNHAKSAIKGMEYAASGIPFVAQATPEYKWLQQEHGIGRTAKKPNNWISLLSAYEDLDRRVEDARANREALEALNIEHKWADWLQVYKDLM